MFGWRQLSPQLIVTFIYLFFSSVDGSSRRWPADGDEKKAATEVWTENPGLQASSDGNDVCSHPTKTAIFKSDKRLYKGTTYKTVKYITF